MYVGSNPIGDAKPIINIMKIVKLTMEDNKRLKRVRNELLTNSNATFKSHTRCNNILKEYADKYGVSTNELYQSIT